MKKDFLPIVLGSDENSYGNCRLLIEAYGVRPLVLCSRRLVPTQNSRVSDYIEIPNFDQDEIFVRELTRVLEREKDNYEKLVVLPCSDYYVTLLTRNRDAFGSLISNSFISYELLQRLEKKHSFYELCDALGLPCPPSYICDVADILEAADKASLGWPLVVKPENSNAVEYLNCHFEGKKKVFILNNAEEYRTAMSSLKESGYSGKMILQKFIPGGDIDTRVINAYCDSNGKVTMMAMGQAVLEEYAPKTLGNYAAIICRPDGELLEKVKQFLEGIGYIGFANFDLKYDRESGKTYVFEINPRIGRSSFFAYSGGVNFMEAFISDTVYGKQNKLSVASKRSLWVNVPFGVLMKYIKDTQIKKELKELKKESGISRTLIWNKDLSPSRFLKIWRYYLMHYRNYRRYYFDK